MSKVLSVPSREHFQGEQWRTQFAGPGVFRWPGLASQAGAVLLWETMRVTGLARGGYSPSPNQRFQIELIPLALESRFLYSCSPM